MNFHRLLACVFAVCFFSLLAQDAVAFYAPHMGRFLNRDPAGQMSRIVVGQPTNSGTSVGFIERDTFDPMANYDDGMNLYQYVKSMPTISTDPSGLFAGVDYGKYCGFSNRGPGKPIDSLDKACQEHDKCLASFWMFINPCLQLSCNSSLCDEAIDAMNGGCDKEWPNDPKARKKCNSEAVEIMGIACAGAGRSIDPITGGPLLPPITTPIP